MKVCVPVKECNGLDSIAYNHFGSAPFFMIYDEESQDTKFIQNGDLHHNHGMCQPLKALSGEAVDVILVGGIGAGALMKLNGLGIKVYRAVSETAQKNMELLKNNILPELSVESSCNHHDCGH